MPASGLMYSTPEYGLMHICNGMQGTTKRLCSKWATIPREDMACAECAHCGACLACRRGAAASHALHPPSACRLWSELRQSERKGAQERCLTLTLGREVHKRSSDSRGTELSTSSLADALGDAHDPMTTKKKNASMIGLTGDRCSLCFCTQRSALHPVPMVLP